VHKTRTHVHFCWLVLFVLIFSLLFHRFHCLILSISLSLPVFPLTLNISHVLSLASIHRHRPGRAL
jgi:hypothetical protein